MVRCLALWVSSGLLAAALAAGCGGIQQKSPSEEVKAFFLAANEAKFQGVKQCLSPHSLDLSAYTHLLQVRYPPTSSVEVLSAPPSRPYQPFAVLEGSSSLTPRAAGTNLLEGFKNKAKEIGADAIIICQPGAAKTEAVAIKYRLEETKNRQ